jgi:hypothetical protein
MKTLPDLVYFPLYFTKTTIEFLPTVLQVIINEYLHSIRITFDFTQNGLAWSSNLMKGSWDTQNINSIRLTILTGLEQQTRDTNIASYPHVLCGLLTFTFGELWNLADGVPKIESTSASLAHAIPKEAIHGFQLVDRLAAGQWRLFTFLNYLEIKNEMDHLYAHFKLFQQILLQKLPHDEIQYEIDTKMMMPLPAFKKNKKRKLRKRR